MKKLLLILSATILLFTTLIFAQATSSSKLLFDQPSATLAEANSYIYKYYPDGATIGTVLMVACTGTTSPFVCSANFPAFTPGAHALTITAANVAGESLKSPSFGFTFVVLPTAPLNIRIG